MTLRFKTSHAIGMAIALTLGSVTSAAAQSTSTTDTTSRSSTARKNTGSGVRVQKDYGSGTRVQKDAGATSTSTGDVSGSASSTMSTTTPTTTATDSSAMRSTMGTTAVDSSAASSSSTMSSSSTTTTTTTTSTGDVPAAAPMPATRFGNGFYVAIQGGANFPQNNLRNGFKTGYGAGGQLGWDPIGSPLGLRLNLNWQRFQGRANPVLNGIAYTGTVNDANLYSALADAKLRLPFGRALGSTSGLYAVGGGGLAYFKNYNNFAAVAGTGAATGVPNQSVTNTFRSQDVTRFALNGGGGFEFGVGPASLFVEGRYVRIFTPNQSADYVPVTLGLSFH